VCSIPLKAYGIELSVENIHCKTNKTNNKNINITVCVLILRTNPACAPFKKHICNQSGHYEKYGWYHVPQLYQILDASLSTCYTVGTVWTLMFAMLLSSTYSQLGNTNVWMWLTTARNWSGYLFHLYYVYNASPEGLSYIKSIWYSHL